MKDIQWYVPRDLLSESIAIMQPHGTKGNEGLALWFGEVDYESACVTHVIELTGSGFTTSPLHINLSLKAMSSLTSLSEDLNKTLVGQIHSHPERMVELSLIDIEGGIRFDNYLSVVCPYYAQKKIEKYIECGVHVYSNSTYSRLPAQDIESRIHVIDATVKRIKHEVHV